ncbi:substrate-binding periplasmic protein [Chitinibacter tainanensis]|uniref:substrate-binding periplasmic protein n=1 Tax=Chitinibacter tainanensis TaxID=230667 RepID=UPI00040E9EE5|nr:transporter substrate-binding domain-containing protein [Chitinibacter tainanensis]
MKLAYAKLSIYLALLLASPATLAIEITLANGEWPPILGEKLPGYGYGSQIVSRAFALQGITVNYEFMPWRRALEETRGGRFHGTLLWTSTPERRTDFYYSLPVYRSQTVLFYHRQQPVSWRDPESLRHSRVGMSNGYFYGPRWRSLQQQQWFQVDQANNDAQSLAKLYAGRIAAFPCEEVVCDYLIGTTLPPQARFSLLYDPNPVHSENLHLLISKKIPQGDWLVKQFDRGLQRMRQTGELTRLLAQAKLQR